MTTWRRSAVKKTLESALFPVLALILLAFWPADPLGYPWWWLVPLLIALRYGVVYGGFSGVVLVLGNLVGTWFLGMAWAMPAGDVVGGFLATVLAGLYASHARNMQIESNARLEYLEQRLESLTRVFYVTRLSHSRLEESLITRPNDLRSALAAVAEELGRHGNGGGAAAPLRDLLQVLAHYGRLNAAAVFEMDAAHPRSHASASIGPQFTLDAGDALVRAAIEDGQSAYYAVDQVLEGQTSAYRLVMPMVAADGTLLALVVVGDMPLLALEEENLLTLTAMVAFAADALQAARVSHGVLQVVPRCPQAFALEWARLGHLVRRAHVQSAWVLLHPGETAHPELAPLLARVRRGLDRYWELPPAHGKPGAVLALLPLTGPLALDGYLQRLDKQCRDELGAPLAQLGWSHRSGALRRGDGAELQAVLTELGHGTDQ